MKTFEVRMSRIAADVYSGTVEVAAASQEKAFAKVRAVLEDGASDDEDLVQQTEAVRDGAEFKFELDGSDWWVGANDDEPQCVVLILNADEAHALVTTGPPGWVRNECETFLRAQKVVL